MIEADGALKACADILAWLAEGSVYRTGRNWGAGGTTRGIAVLPTPTASTGSREQLRRSEGHIRSPRATRRECDTTHQPGPDDSCDAATRGECRWIRAKRMQSARRGRILPGNLPHTSTILPTVEEIAPLGVLRLANGAKGEQQSTIQQGLTWVCIGCVLTPDLYCPVVTTGIKQMLSSHNFAGNGPDDLTAG